MSTSEHPEKNPSILTQWAKATGCSCKIAPTQLKEILQSGSPKFLDKKLLVGNENNDDAAVYALDETTGIIATTDFFTPVVDDPYYFGKIAAANALSDVYAMGGKPIMALAVLGWPVDTLPAATAAAVLEGARSICTEAEISLAGGHSIQSSEPFFGLAVNGLICLDNLKQNNTAQEGDLLFLTKPIGVGLMTTAAKRSVLPDDAKSKLLLQLSQLNSLGAAIAKIPGVHAMTDITGFGLLGHLIEMAEGSQLSAQLNYTNIPIFPIAKELAAQRIVPDATYRNWNSYCSKVAFNPGVNVMEAFNLLPDPQTNGGLLIAVAPTAAPELQALLQQHGYLEHLQPIGTLTAKADKIVTVI